MADSSRADALDSFLRAAALRSSIYLPFDGLPPTPVPIDAKAPDPSALTELTRRYGRDGFAVFSVGSQGPLDPSTLISVASALGLGAAYVPPMYRQVSGSSGYGEAGVNVIGIPPAIDRQSHPAFHTSARQELHCDGTLQDIGEVPTSVLLCVTPARDGGTSIIFKSVAAFVDLANREFALALALTHDGCLRRAANLSKGRLVGVGPAFALRGDELISRYSCGADDGAAAEPAAQRQLKRAVSSINRLAVSDSGFYQEFRLAQGEGLIMANDRVSHARTAYQDPPGRRRQVLRGLFCRRVGSTPYAECLA
jgi:hypothetical protein